MKVLCDTCNLVGGYCGNCDGSHWMQKKSKSKSEESTMQVLNLDKFVDMLNDVDVVCAGSNAIDPLEFDVKDGEVFLGGEPLNVYRIEEARDSSNVLVLHCEDEEWDGMNLVFVS